MTLHSKHEETSAITLCLPYNHAIRQQHGAARRYATYAPPPRVPFFTALCTLLQLYTLPPRLRLLRVYSVTSGAARDRFLTVLSATVASFIDSRDASGGLRRSNSVGGFVPPHYMPHYPVYELDDVRSALFPYPRRG